MFKYTKLTLLREIAIIAASLIVLSPFYILFVTSFKSNQDILTTSPMGLPAHPTAGNFATAWSGGGSESLLDGIIDSAIITLGTIAVLVILGSLAAYTISRRRNKLGAGVYIWFLIGIILPFQLGIIPVFIVLRHLHLVGTLPGLILLYSGLLMPLAVFLYTGFARRLPYDYEEAAYIDGASKFKTFWRVIFPLLGPATGTVSILAGLIIWNDFFSQLVFLSGSTHETLPVVVYNFVGSLVARWNVIFAAVIISMAPILALYIVAQRRFIRGFAGGIKQ